MKLSQVDTKSLNNELIKAIFFITKKEKYDNANYIIIYGCHIKELLDERLNYALEVLNNHKFEKVILTGGIGINGNFNESEYMKNYLINNSIDESQIIIESNSKTTEENNINIMNMLNLNSVDKPINIALITQQLHLFRIILHWSKILKNNNVNFYYDYVENSVLSYDKIINDSKLVELVKSQVEKAKKFINDGKYIDIDIKYISDKGSENNDKR